MNAATIEAGGVALAVDDRGTGPGAVFVHGTAASRTVWRETIDALGDDVRTVAYDRRAYGESGAPEPYGGTTVGEQADDLAALVGSLAIAPAVLVGHGLGAMVVMDVMLRRADLVKAAYEKNVSNARELQDILTKVTTEASDILSRRVVASLDEIKSVAQKPKAVERTVKAA